MALIQCPQCGKQISDTAPRCPHCGTSFTKNADGNNCRKNTLFKKRPKQRLVVAILVIVIIISAIYGIKVFKTIKDTTSEVSNMASEIIQNYGLHLNKVTLKPKKHVGMLYFHADYRLSGFGNLQEPEMLECAKALNDLKANGRFIFLEHIYSDGDTYDFYISSSVIKKNGSTILDDYYHSESYYDVHNKQSEPSSHDGVDRSRDAWVCAIEYVKDNLKSPSTAKFCKYTDATVMRVDEDEYIIHGYVDAKNSLGATVRQIWTVSLFLTEKGFRDPYLEWG